MQTYIILTRFSPDVFSEPKDFRAIASKVSQRIKEACPGLVWKDSYAILGQYDAIDIVETDDSAEVERAALIIRGHGHSTTETLPGTPWKQFLERL